VTIETSAGSQSHAEIRRVWPRDGHIQILGVIIIDGIPDDAPVDTSWTLRLTSRERPEIPVLSGVQRLTNRLKRAVSCTSPPTPRRLYFPVVSDGAHFETVVTVNNLAVWDALPREHWDLHVVAARGGRNLILRVGRHHDDMPGKKQIVKFPEQYVSGVAVLPYYTDDNDLSIRCARHDTGKRSAT
jgi:hypothetical protein